MTSLGGGHSQEERQFTSVLREYISLRNADIFFFMMLSLIPAAIFQALYMKLDIIHIKGIIYTPYLEIPYTRFLSPEYDFIIQPLIVFASMNFGLIGMKIMGWAFEDEKGLDINKFVVLGLIILFVALVFSRLPVTKWILPFAVLFFLYLLTKSCSKVVIFLNLLILNLYVFTLYNRVFLFEVIIDNSFDGVLTDMARIGLSWLYILPYNFFIFFPVVIAVYSWKFRHPEKYISSFFEIVFHENMVAVFVGLLLNATLSATPLFIYLSQSELPIPLASTDTIERMIDILRRVFVQEDAVKLSTFEILTLIHLWIGSFILWFTPFFVSLTQLETKFEASFDRKLREIIQKVKNHIVVIGYGNLGKEVCTDLIERGVIHLGKDTTEILTPDLEVQKICRNLLVVDLNDQLFDRVHTDPILQNVGVARKEIRGEGRKGDILIPAIVGDINSETIKDSSQLRTSKFFISAPSDYRATFTLSKFANAEDLNSIISVEDSAQKDYFSPKMTAHDTFLIYPAFQEGIALGRIVSLCYFRELHELERNPEIVIAGEGKQIHYLIETFWMEMERAGIAPSWVEEQRKYKYSNSREKVYRIPISILTDSEEIEGRIKPKEWKMYEKKGELQEIIIRSAHKNEDDACISVDVILDEPDRLKTIERTIEDKIPQIIVITSDTIQKVSKIFHEWGIAVERYNFAKNGNYKPVIIVGVLGEEYEEIKDILLYYTKMKPDSGSRFPIQYLDAAVRVYDDSTQQIGGLAQAFTRGGFVRYEDKEFRGIRKVFVPCYYLKDIFRNLGCHLGKLVSKKLACGEIGDPFAVYCCLEDVPGSLGYQLGKLAGIEFAPFDSHETGNLVSLHFCRFQNCSGVENYSFLANAELLTNEDINGKDKLSYCLFQSENDEEMKREAARAQIAELLNVTSLTEFMNIENQDPSQFLERCSYCKRRITCSISSYLRKIENLIANREYYMQLEIDEKIDRGAVDWELGRFFINPDYENLVTDEKQESRDLPKAAILVCCRYSRITGSLSTAVNNLLFKKIDKIYDKTVADTTYLRSYECYDPSFTYVEFYGNFVRSVPKNKRELLRENGSIDLAFINVVTGKAAWINYAKTLCDVLNSIYREDQYKVYADENRDNIAIIREGFIEDENSRNITCRKQDCMIQSKMRLLRIVR